MAPGCYSPTSSVVKSNESTRPSSSLKPSIEQLESFVQEVIEIEVIQEEEETTTMTTTTNSSKNETTESNTTNLYEKSALECYADEINLDQIPLPSTPPPPESLYQGHDDATGDDEEEESSDDEDESESEEEEDDDSSSSSDDEHEDEDEEEDDKLEDDEEEQEDKKEGNPKFLLNERPRIMKSSRRESNLIFVDTADTFEILEQTIIKQKRLAKLKNTDLRRKVLLKRTFDLVLEIMDAENGFDDDDDTTKQPQHQQKPSLSVSSCSISNNNSSVHQRSLNLDDEQTSSIHNNNNNNNELELHLHPDPSCRMDDSDEEEQEETSSSSTSSMLSSSSSLDESEEEIKTTLLKLVDMETSPTQTTSSNENDELSSCLVARVPRQLKRRSSGSDDEHDGDDEDEDVETDQSDLLNRFDDETYFYEYSMGLLDDQQLNYSSDRPRKLDADADLNIYNDSPVVESEQLVVEKSTRDRKTSNGSSQPTRRRSDHPRKKLKTNA